MSHDLNMAGSKKWRKCLYEDQGVPDNYVDSSFLDEMKKNRKHLVSDPLSKIIVSLFLLCGEIIFSPMYRYLRGDN